MKKGLNIYGIENMYKISFTVILVLLLNIGLANAITQQEINEAKTLMDSKIDCRNLSDSQLEIIGEYYMEQMHPGEAHELMHKMMGLQEGSRAEELFHINMAKRLYCNEDSGLMTGMMGSGGMMNMMTGTGNMMDYGMIGYGYGNTTSGWIWTIFMALFWVLVIVGIIVLIKWLLNQSKIESKDKLALDILKERYAKGEIDKTQFEDMKKELIG